MNKRPKLIVIPGLNDWMGGYYKFLLVGLRAVGLRPALYTFGWEEAKGDDFELRIKKFYRYLDAQPDKVNIIGISAGGMSALHALIDKPDKVYKVVTISSPISGTLTSPNKLVYGTYRRLVAKMPSLTAEQKSRILTMSGKHDKIVPVNESKLPDVRHIIVPVRGHLLAIFIGMMVYAGRMRRFFN